MKLLNRDGYGSNFNNIYIYDNKIKKESKNEYGLSKIVKEINFYKNIPDNILKTPTIIEYGNNYYIMEYLEKYVPLYTLFKDIKNLDKYNILNTIYNQLNIFHEKTKINVNKDEYIKCYKMETYDKIITRFKEITDIVSKYKYITHVNGIKIIDFDEAIDKINNKIIKYLEKKLEYNMCIIHGDCQFNNILINKENNDIVFIDPRGYFGNKDLYGVSEYDIAKVRFALSGYDIFDNMTISGLTIIENNIQLDDIFQIDESEIFKKDIIDLLIVSIWLGNAHCFKANEYKAMYSYFYALYLATLYL